MRPSSYRIFDIILLAVGCAAIGAIAYFALYLSATVKDRPRLPEPPSDQPSAVYRLSLPPPALDTDVNGRPMGEN